MKIFKISESGIPKNTGVYAIVNKYSGKIYIGSTSCKKGFYKRINEHYNGLKNNRHHCVALQNSFNKYGEDSFEVWIVEECNGLFCLLWEQFYLETWNPEYNTAKKANAPMSGRRHTQETKKKMSESQKTKKNLQVKKQKRKYLTVRASICI